MSGMLVRAIRERKLAPEYKHTAHAKESSPPWRRKNTSPRPRRGARSAHWRPRPSAPGGAATPRQRARPHAPGNRAWRARRRPGMRPQRRCRCRRAARRFGPNPAAPAEPAKLCVRQVLAGCGPWRIVPCYGAFGDKKMLKAPRVSAADRSIDRGGEGAPRPPLRGCWGEKWRPRQVLLPRARVIALAVPGR